MSVQCCAYARTHTRPGPPESSVHFQARGTPAFLLSGQAAVASGGWERPGVCQPSTFPPALAEHPATPLSPAFPSRAPSSSARGLPVNKPRTEAQQGEGASLMTLECSATGASPTRTTIASFPCKGPKLPSCLGADIWLPLGSLESVGQGSLVRSFVHSMNTQ